MFYTAGFKINKIINNRLTAGFGYMMMINELKASLIVERLSGKFIRFKPDPPLKNVQ